MNRISRRRIAELEGSRPRLAQGGLERTHERLAGDRGARNDVDLGALRADHLGAITIPMLFLSGTRDELADLDLLEPVCKKLGKRATLRPLDTADHGFRTLTRSRKSGEDVFVEMARIVREWASSLR